MSQFSINRVVLVGRLTRAVELRSLPSGRSAASLRVACNSSRRDADGQTSERPNYFDVNVYGAVADSVARYTTKGTRIGIDGKLEWREWETAEQQRRQAVAIVADVVQFLDAPTSRGHEEAPEPEPEGGDLGELVGVGADELDVTF